MLLHNRVVVKYFRTVPAIPRRHAASACRQPVSALVPAPSCSYLLPELTSDSLLSHEWPSHAKLCGLSGPETGPFARTIIKSHQQLRGRGRSGFLRLSQASDQDPEAGFEGQIEGSAVHARGWLRIADV